MINYTVRVELHDADKSNKYENLHKQMKLEGFSRSLGIDGIRWELPTSEYSIVSDLAPEKILSKAQIAVYKIQSKPEPSILVTGSITPRVFSGLERFRSKKP
ncbi:MAG: hypothetical protein PW844_17220 [Pantoea sp.]|uniref:hypothetical protein n=1 Tax=Pantoea sp. TaxID=69393 RepID=UPI00238A164B|nr:hypothetical protein [Pantoea sp.]MDE1188208.1 hypothetical protein [Pantoea sp.]